MNISEKLDKKFEDEKLVEKIKTQRETNKCIEIEKYINKIVKELINGELGHRFSCVKTHSRMFTFYFNLGADELGKFNTYQRHYIFTKDIFNEEWEIYLNDGTYFRDTKEFYIKHLKQVLINAVNDYNERIGLFEQLK